MSTDAEHVHAGGGMDQLASCTCCVFTQVAKEGDVCALCFKNEWPSERLTKLKPRMQWLGIWRGEVAA